MQTLSLSCYTLSNSFNLLILPFYHLGNANYSITTKLILESVIAVMIWHNKQHPNRSGLSPQAFISQSQPYRVPEAR